MNPLTRLIEHHRIHELRVFHTTIHIPVIKRFENLPEHISLCQQILHVLRSSDPFSMAELLYAALSFREEYLYPPAFPSTLFIKDLFYQWIVATITSSHEIPHIKAKLLWTIFSQLQYQTNRTIPLKKKETLCGILQIL